MDDQTVQTQPSFKYFLYRWRRTMGASYKEMRKTPLDVIRADLEYIGIENKIEAAKMNN